MMMTAVPAAAALIGCGQSGDAGPAIARAPARVGQVWETDRAADRAAAPAALLAFVNGVHVMVLDGNEAFAGMTRLTAERGADGGRTLKLSNGLDARLVPAGETIELRFSSGETIPMRKRDNRKSEQ